MRRTRPSLAWALTVAVALAAAVSCSRRDEAASTTETTSASTESFAERTHLPDDVFAGPHDPLATAVLPAVADAGARAPAQGRPDGGAEARGARDAAP